MRIESGHVTHEQKKPSQPSPPPAGQLVISSFYGTLGRVVILLPKEHHTPLTVPYPGRSKHGPLIDEWLTAEE